MRGLDCSCMQWKLLEHKIAIQSGRRCGMVISSAFVYEPVWLKRTCTWCDHEKERIQEYQESWLSLLREPSNGIFSVHLANEQFWKQHLLRRGAGIYEQWVLKETLQER